MSESIHPQAHSPGAPSALGLTGQLHVRLDPPRIVRKFADAILPAIARRSTAPLAAALVDADRFRQVNDRYGHAVGDRAVVTVARALRQTLRGTNLACHRGGEEFAVLLPDSGARRGTAVAKPLGAVAPQEPRAAFGPRRLSLSIGLAQTHRDDTPADALGRAGAALNAARHTGRDQTVHAD